MSDNPFVVVDSEVSNYIKHDYKSGNWYNGTDILDANYFMVDPDTIKLGWSSYDVNTGYDEVWQDDIYTPIAKPSEEHKNAFFIWMLPKYIEGDKNITHRPMLWKRSSHAEYTGFMNMGRQFFEASKLPENKGKLPVLKHLRSEEIKYKSGFKSMTPLFELVSFQDRPDTFIMPEQNLAGEGALSPDEATSQPQSSPASLNDEIPF